MPKHGKRYRDALAEVARKDQYDLEGAITVLKRTATSKFDETVEIHLRTGCDPRHADQLVRGVAALPHGLGKEVRVAVFASGDAARQAQEAGADAVGEDDLIKRIEDGWVQFDVAIATPEVMGKIARLGRILGRRGLMPNPKSGTVVQAQDIPRAINDARMGRVEFRMDRTAIIHAPVGKANFEEGALLANLETIVDNVVRARPTSLKGQYIRSAYLTSTMGPSIRLDLSKLLTVTVE
ncbi:MAG: 50S ribosomal protein L1 [Chloroflexi bacterium]|nr:50S ribosomal protein L1 [Chloroflexota bacterium]